MFKYKIIIFKKDSGSKRSCCRLNSGPQKICVPRISECDLFEINFFADIINIKILKWNHLRLGWALNPMTIILRQKRTEREGYVKMEGKTGIMLPQKPKNMWGHQRIEETKESFLESSDMAWPCWHLDLDFYPPELCRNKFLLFKASKFLWNTQTCCCNKYLKMWNLRRFPGDSDNNLPAM